MNPSQRTPQSPLEKLRDYVIGIPLIIVFPLVGYWTVVAIQKAWPISAYTIVASIPLIAFWKTQNRWGKALVGTLKPIALGLGAVFLLALLLNSGSAPSPEALRQFEEWVLVTSNHFPSWSKLPVIAAIGVYVALSVASVYLPRLRLIHRLGVARHYLGLTGAALVVMASFTFFSAHAFQHTADDIITPLTAQFRDSKQREANEVAQYLAYEAVARSVRHIAPTERQFYAVFLDVLSAYDPGTAHVRDRQVGRGIFDAATASSEPEGNSSKWERIDIRRRLDVQRQAELQLKAMRAQNPATAGSESEGNSSKSDMIDHHRSLDVQLQGEVQLKSVCDQKLADAQDGLKKAVSEVIGLGTDMLRERAFYLFESLGLAVQPELAKEVKTYLGKVSDDALDSKLEPHLNRFATVLSEKINQFAQRSVAPGSQRRAAEVALMDACVTVAAVDLEAADRTSDEHEAAKELDQARETLDIVKEVRGRVVFDLALPRNMKSRLSAIDSAIKRATERYDTVIRDRAKTVRVTKQKKIADKVEPEFRRIP